MVSDQYDPYENIKKQSSNENTEKNGLNGAAHEDMKENSKTDDTELSQKKKKAKNEKKIKNKEKDKEKKKKKKEKKEKKKKDKAEGKGEEETGKEGSSDTNSD